MSTIPDPATTDWVPLQGRPSGMAYYGQYQTGHAYQDGDCVIGADGVLYACVTDGTTTAPVPWPGAAGPAGPAGPQGPQGVGIPMPVVNGSWVKGVGGAAVWSQIQPADVANGILAMSGNQFRANWTGTSLDLYIDNAKVCSGMGGTDHWMVLGTDVAYQGSFANYSAPYGPCRFRKLASGLVICEGLMNVYATGLAFICPPGYQPTSGNVLIFNTSSSMAGTTETWRLDSGGNFSYTGPSAAGWVSMSGCQWFAGPATGP